MKVGQLSDRVIVVAGSNGALGAALTEALASAGARVVAADSVEPTSAPPDGARFLRLDVTSQDSWRSLGEDVRRHEGVVHGLVNTPQLGFPDRLGDVELDDWRRALSVNVAGAIYGIQALHEMMPSGSSIVNVGSSIAFTGYPAAAETATMWALRGLTHAANLELGHRGIRVNAVHPGRLEDEVDRLPEGFADVALTLTTLNRLRRADDVTSVIAFLLSDASSYIAGTDIPVDGGSTSHAGAKLARSGMTR